MVRWVQGSGSNEELLCEFRDIELSLIFTKAIRDICKQGQCYVEPRYIVRFKARSY